MPGEYTVRLTVNGHSFTAPLTVKMDPRVKTPLAGLEQQFHFETHLASRISSMTEAARQARSLREQLEKLSGKATGPLAGSIGALERKVTDLVGRPGGFLAPLSPELTLLRVSSEVGTLYGDIGRADATPTASQVTVMAGIERDFSGAMALWNTVQTLDLPPLNQQLRSTGLPEIRLESKPGPELESDNEE